MLCPFKMYGHDASQHKKYIVISGCDYQEKSWMLGMYIIWHGVHHPTPQAMLLNCITNQLTDFSAGKVTLLRSKPNTLFSEHVSVRVPQSRCPLRGNARRHRRWASPLRPQASRNTMKTTTFIALTAPYRVIELKHCETVLFRMVVLSPPCTKWSHRPHDWRHLIVLCVMCRYARKTGERLDSALPQLVLHWIQLYSTVAMLSIF